METSRISRMALALPLAAALALLAGDAGAAKAPSKSRKTPATAGQRPAAKAAAAEPAVPFIEDDYAKALEEARARAVPIFIESWAPW